MKIILCQPATKYFAWQVEIAIESYLANGIKAEDIYIVIADHKDYNLWRPLFDKYKDINFETFHDANYNKEYIPCVKPFLMWCFFERYPKLIDSQFFYCDADCILTKPLPEFSKNKVYLSDTVSYLGYDYILSKGQEVLDLMCDTAGISVDLVKKNQEKSGGAQYVFSGIPTDMWQKAYYDSIKMYKIVSKYNADNYLKYKGDYPVQIWCSEMWTTLWGFWLQGRETEVVKELNFTWSTCHIIKMEKTCLLHNAGVTVEMQDLFRKFDFTTSLPYKTRLTINPERSSFYYYNFLKEVGQNTCLNY